MAAGPWKLYDTAKLYIGDNTLDMDGAENWQVALFKTVSGGDITLSAYSELTSEVDNGNGYLTGGTSLLSPTWLHDGVNASVIRFDAADPSWSCDTANIESVKMAIIYASDGELLCYSTLTATGEISVTPTNALTLVFPAAGIFEME